VLIDHAFAALNLHRVAIVCATGNARSRAIPERLGLVYEGTLRGAEWLYSHYVDHAVYAQLQCDWQQDIIRRLAGGTAAAGVRSQGSARHPAPCGGTTSGSR
jgi:ribosomal-protein-serine acetyltransferase